MLGNGADLFGKFDFLQSHPVAPNFLPPGLHGAGDKAMKGKASFVKKEYQEPEQSTVYSRVKATGGVKSESYDYGVSQAEDSSDE